MAENDKRQIKEEVRKAYAQIAEHSSNRSSCCGGKSGPTDAHLGSHAQALGYSQEELESIPQGANLGLGCGNPLAIDEVSEGQVVVDLGCGAGFDVFLAARKVGERGFVVGVDMTPQMLEKARQNAKRGGFENVQFRHGEIEDLPLDDNFADVIISNCVINLSPDKRRVFNEAFRVLKPGGKLMISDIVLTKPLPKELVNDVEAYVGCVAGASLKDDYLRRIEEAGFCNVEVVASKSGEQFKLEQAECGGNIADQVYQSIESIQVKALKPEGD